MRMRMSDWGQVIHMMKVGIRATRQGLRIQTPGPAPTHIEVLHFCCKSKNTGSTPHGPFPLIVLLGIKPGVHKLEEEDNTRRGPFICVPRTESYSWTWLLQSIRAKVLTAGPLLLRGRLYVGLAPEISFSPLSCQVSMILYPPAPHFPFI